MAMNTAGARGARGGVRLLVAAGLASMTLGVLTATAQHAHHGAEPAPRATGAKGAERMPRGALGSSATVDAAGAIWAVHTDGNHVVVRRSADAGATWSAPVRVNAQPERIEADGDSRPKIATGPGGEVYVTWTKPLSRPYTGEIRFSRSLDGGKTFSEPVAVHADRQEITHRFDSVATSKDGRVFVAWLDKRDGVAARAAKAKPEYRGAAIYFAVSDDRGASFRGDFKVADHSCECCRISLLPQQDGSMLAMWRHVFEPNERDHAVAQLNPDGSVTRFRRATFDRWRIDACPHHGPSLARDADGQLHAVWFNQGPQNAGVSYGRLRDGGVEGQRRIGGEAAEHADLAIIGRRVALVWKEFDGEQSVLRAMRSDDAGRNWTEHRLGATGGASAQPRVLVRDGRFIAFWHTRQEAVKTVVLP
jgi:hypothetical protein